MDRERRREPRAVRPSTVSFSFSTKNGCQADGVPAMLLNVSSTGLGIISARPLTEGMNLRFFNHSSKNTSGATVIWCRQEGKFLFKVGLARK